MRCTVCAGQPRTATTDLPFKVSDTTIVILKRLPVVQCARCPDYLIDDEVLRKVDEILARVEGGTETDQLQSSIRSAVGCRPIAAVEWGHADPRVRLAAGQNRPH